MKRIAYLFGVANLFGVGCLTLGALAGCADSASRVRLERLAQADLVVPERSWKLRVPSGITLPNRITRPLCDEFILLEIHNNDDLKEFCKVIGLPGNDYHPDLSQGTLIGVVASVGESMTNDWPVSIEKIRIDHGAGWIQARFHPGAYYPINVASYCHLAYVRGLDRVMMVEINRRTFVAQ